MKRLAILVVASLALAGCTTTGGLDYCKYSAQRRQVYATAVTAAIAYEASGRPVPRELVLGRQAAETALAVLNARCPAP